MRWITSKSLCLSLLMAAPVTFATVPVTDKGSHKMLESMDERLEVIQELMDLQVKVMGESGTSTLEMLKSNNKAMSNINQALANVMVGTAKGQSQAIEMRRNADLYDANMGAKPSSACGVLSASLAVSHGSDTQKRTKSKMKQLGEAYIERSRYLSPTESLAGDRGIRVLQLRKREREIEAAVGPLSVMSDEGLPISDAVSDDVWVVMHAKMMNMAVPTPVQLTETSEDLDQPLADAIDNSAKLIQVDRQEMINDVISQHVASRIKVFDASWIKSMAFTSKNGTIGIPQRVLNEINTGISETDTFNILSNYRLQNPEWITTTMGKSNEIGLLRDANLIGAQQLQLLNKLYQQSKQTNLFLAYIYGHQIEQSGAPRQPILDTH